MGVLEVHVKVGVIVKEDESGSIPRVTLMDLSDRELSIVIDEDFFR